MNFIPNNLLEIFNIKILSAHKIHIRLTISVLIMTISSACTSLKKSENINFELIRNVPIVKTMLKTTPNINFLIDTGVDPSVIDIELSQNLNLPVDESETGKASGTGDEEGLEIQRASILDLSLGGKSYATIDAVAADLSSFSSVLDIELGGILGYSFLRNQIVRIDYRYKQIAFAENIDLMPELSSPITSSYVLPLIFNSEEDTIPVFTLSINGEPIVVSLDTGKSSGIEFYEAETQKLNRDAFSSDHSESTRLGARGERTVKTGMADQITIGPYTLNNIPISFSPRAPHPGIRQGNAGNALLKHFVITIDYPGRKVIFAQ